jgi:hypothetical protein
MNARCLASNVRQDRAGWTRRNSHTLLLSTGLAILLLFATVLHAGITASISGTVTDASGAAVQGARVTATQVDTGVTTTLETNGQGFYSFQSLPLGKYTIAVEQKGFKSYEQTNLILDVNSALVVDVALQVGQETEKVEVLSSALHVETSNTQMGEVIEGKEMTDVPLVTRSYTDLLALQPGVVSSSSGMNGALGGSFTSAGFSPPLVSGSENAGALSVNGMREAANGFILNGILVQETGFSGAGAIPNLDSIAEFRILTNNFDAEYGNYSGGQINVITKSGTNDWHGNGFEFYRNTNLDAANFFNAGQRGTYHQNQFGGTFGGPIVRDKVFFFLDYQGNRLTQPVSHSFTGAPTAATESGDFSAIAGSLTGTVKGNAWASQINQQLGLPTGTIFATEPYYTNGCTSYAQCVFPNAQLPTTAFSPIATNLLKYITPANGQVAQDGTGTFSSNSGTINLSDNKFSTRLDANTGIGLLFGYFYFDRFDRADPYWQSNAPLYPGFSVDSNGQTYTIDLGATKTFGSSSVNELRLGYFRLNTKFNQPLGGTGVTLTSLGFASGSNGAPGVFVGTPSVQGVPEIDFNNFVIGVPSRPNQLVENIYQVLDNYSWILGRHSLRMGGQYHYNQLEENLSNVANGNYFFGSNFSGGQPSETGSDFVDFLLGAPSSYVQGQSYPSYGRNFYFGLYAQDSWRVKSNLTFNYGLRYDVSAPWHEKYNEIQTLIQGEQSIVFPGSPIGWVYPGDPGVPSSLAPTRWNNFAPRLGLAYSFGGHEGIMGKLLGKPGTTSIRVGWGMFYTSFEGATDFNEIGDAPFGNYTGQNQSTFAAPFTNRASGASITNLFPVAPPPHHFSASYPATGFPYTYLSDFYGAFGTIGSSPAFYNKNRLPYAENYELSIQRQVTTSDLVSVSYVGTQGHRLLSSESANPGIPSLCLALLAAGCGPGGENNIYTAGDGTVTAGTRGPFSAPYRNTPVNGQYIVPFGNDSYFISAGYSSYNSAQLSWRHTSKSLQLLFGYTFSKSLDNSSGYGEQFNPSNPRLSRGLSAFDSTHNFVASYAYALPFDKLPGPKKLTNGWQISGITRFSTGLPVTILETDDRSLLGTGFGGPITLPVDTPNLLAPVKLMNPRNPSHIFFSTSSFGAVTLGEEGNSSRRFFHGPGTNNWDMALLKTTQLTERVNLQFRAEFFNIFNHAQFINPSGGGLASFNCPVSNQISPTGCTQNSSSFGVITTAADPRIGQLSLKVNF